MLSVTVVTRGSDICSVEARGHSGYDRSGRDIVCAAISTLMQALHLGLAEVARAESFEFSADPEVPSMKLSWNDASSEVQVLARTMVLSMQAIAGEYPKFAEIREAEA